MKKITVIGGGTGSFVVLSGLKNLKGVEIASIVPSTDSGGSTGRLRDEFGFLPVGDLRQVLVALAENSEEQKILRELFSYRFEKGNGLEGHNFGNIFMTALRDIVKDELKSIEYIEKLLNIKGSVCPVTLENCQLVAEYENGDKLIGEHNIDEPPYPHDGNLKITNLYTKPKVESHDKLKRIINKSDYIIIGPGDLYTSLLANLVVNDVAKYIKDSKAKVIYISNLVTKFGQTTNFTLSDHVNEVEKYLGKKLDKILVNKSTLPKQILKKYEKENAYPVQNDMKENRVVLTDLLATEEIKTKKGDTLVRSLIRHDGEKIAKKVEEIVNER